MTPPTLMPPTPPDPRRLAASRKLSEVRRRAGMKSFRRFAETYLPKHFTVPPSSMHLELFEMLQAAVTARGARLAVAAPRGHAKSTIVSCAYLLWCLCYGLERYILLISDSGDQANDLLSHAKEELAGNPLLGEDFPEVFEPEGPARWRKDEIITRSGIKVTALGAGKRIRGRRHQQDRPTLIIVDDVENEAEVRSEDQRRNRQDWFKRAVLKCGTDQTNVFVVGTILHYDSLLASIILGRAPCWTTRKYQAVRAWSQRPDLWQRWENIHAGREQDVEDGPAQAQAFFEQHRDQMLDGTDVLWPQREDYLSLMKQRLADGRASFDSEKQNEPVNPDDCYFPDADFTYWDDRYDDEDALFTALGRESRFVGACDPSLGRAGKGRGADDTAIVTLMLHFPTGKMYVVDADIRKRLPDAIIQSVIDYGRRRDYWRFVFETNQFQEFLYQQTMLACRKARVQVPLYGVNHTSDKRGRIQRLQPLITSGGLLFSRRHRTLLEQLWQFPLGAHDDGPDALEMAVEAASYPPEMEEMVVSSVYDDPQLGPLFRRALCDPLEEEMELHLRLQHALSQRR